MNTRIPRYTWFAGGCALFFVIYTVMYNTRVTHLILFFIVQNLRQESSKLYIYLSLANTQIIYKRKVPFALVQVSNSNMMRQTS